MESQLRENRVVESSGSVEVGDRDRNVVQHGGSARQGYQRSTAPESQPLALRAWPRWSVAGHAWPIPSTGLSAAGIMVCVGPPLFASGASLGSARSVSAGQVPD